ncbi:uncharacterized protein DEA37_0002599 [Paragonimus westermani]|uniref:LITAF domain-containing protein n=1 Tax=Paragonimus westermani TaxID=34504 RepID=A0A5J4P0V7_9TREM|nr:uncharacterized protein DEA37_0002599 [Paragonimus westermani]
MLLSILCKILLSAMQPKRPNSNVLLLTDPVHAITEQPSAVIVSTNLGPNSQNFLCSICLNKVVTTVQYVNGSCTWLACTGIFFIG